MEDVISNNTQQDSQEQSGSDAKSGETLNSTTHHTLESILPKNQRLDQCVPQNSQDFQAAISLTSEASEWTSSFQVNE
jgi:hypothetical protein